MKRFTRSSLPFPAFALVAGLVLATALSAIDRASAAGPSSRHLYIVAHQDDDLLFMSPDVQKSIDAGHTVETVYVTAGANTCTQSTEFWLGREAGVLAAYARMAGVSDQWTLMEDQPIREVRLVGRPHVSLVFFRLPHGSIDGAFCPEDGANLRTLWSGESSTITALDGSAVYTRAQLIGALAGLIRQFHPDRIATLDSSGLFGTGQDPSGITIDYAPPWFCDWYDNSDHYYSAVFASAARATYGRAHDFRRYRAYNMANEAPNVSGDDLTRKAAVFEMYAERDSSIPDDPPFGGLYDNWLERQYLVPGGPFDGGTVCVVE